jgi:hypothetical protein
MNILFLAIALIGMQQTPGVAGSFNGPQIKHDTEEFNLYNRLHADQDAIADIWRPSPKLLSDYRAARRCYVQFHLYKAEGCKVEFDMVDQDLNRAKE